MKDPDWMTQATDESGHVTAAVPKFPAVFITKDSGKRHEEITGARRDTNEGKGRFDLIAALPLKRLAQLYQRGATKYGDRNWEKGINLSRYLDSAMRHINDYQLGDREEDHLIAAAWNLFSFVFTEDQIKKGKLPQSLDNGNFLGGNDDRETLDAGAERERKDTYFTRPSYGGDS